MLTKTTLLCSLVPVGLALALGIIVGRRKKNHSSKGSAESSVSLSSKPPLRSSPNATLTPSASLTIPDKAISTKKSSPQVVGTLCKSAPIDINRIRILPNKLTNIKNDRDIILPEKTNASVNNEEELDLVNSPDNLCGSGEDRCVRFLLNARTVKEGNPVIIKANKSPKVSPEHSFIEAKFAKHPVDTNHQPPQVAMITATAKNISLSDKCCKDNVMKAMFKKITNLSPPSSLSSIHSKDSGKGSTPPRFDEPITSYEFLVKQELVGTILGRKGAFVREIKKQSQANVFIIKHPTKEYLKVVCIEGKQKQIDEALKMLRARLPVKRHPGLTMKQVFLRANNDVRYFNTNEMQLNVSCLTLIMFVSNNLSLKLALIEGINNDVIISSILSGGHIFVQQPVHPTYPGLSILNRCMNNNYSKCETLPLLEEHIIRDVICAAKIHEFWYRVQIVCCEPRNVCIVKFLDYGGYKTVNTEDLRQIRADFMTVPFQAIECVLANIRPVDGIFIYPFKRHALQILLFFYRR